VAETDASVLIVGETGTGKELIAQAIHQNSRRKKKPFVPLNCAALSEHLLESELFGHVRGAFTDAAADRVGRFEYAHGGTLFLDEVGDTPLPTQIKLLRVLENGEITRIGENKPVDVNVRILSATNRDLDDLIEAGDFRRDLYHRLKVVTVMLPPLRDRREDIVPLVDHFRKLFSKKHGKSIKGIAGDVRKKLFDLECWKWTTFLLIFSMKPNRMNSKPLKRAAAGRITLSENRWTIFSVGRSNRLCSSLAGTEKRRPKFWESALVPCTAS
jgi:two-component system response regulator HydG